MDTVILAAGRGERLHGIVAKYHKPLVLVNGQPLVRRAVHIAHEVAGGRVIVVVAPQNASVISEVLDDVDEPRMIIQRHATGPGVGLLVGMELVRTEKALVLMADNVLSVDDVRAVVEAEPYGIGVQRLPATEDAIRFTRLHPDGRWIEKKPYTEDEFSQESAQTGRTVTAWVGPITVSPGRVLNALPTFYRAFFEGKSAERPIGPYLDEIAPGAVQVPVTTIDIGTPEAVIS